MTVLGSSLRKICLTLTFGSEITVEVRERRKNTEDREYVCEMTSKYDMARTAVAQTETGPASDLPTHVPTMDG